MICRRRRVDRRHESRDLTAHSRYCFISSKCDRDVERVERGLASGVRGRRSGGHSSRRIGDDVSVQRIGISVRRAHVKPDTYVPGMQKAWKGRSGAKWVRKLGGGEEDKGGDLLPKLLLTPLLPALRLLVPNLLWALLANHPRVVEEEPGVEEQSGEGGRHNRIMNQWGTTQSATSPRAGNGWSTGTRLTNPVV